MQRRFSGHARAWDMRRIICMMFARKTLLLAALAGAAGHAAAQVRCLDEGVAATGPLTAQAPVTATERAATPRERLAAMVSSALERSHASGAAELLAEAALSDVDEARAATEPQTNMTLSIGPEGSRTDGVGRGSMLRASGTLQITGLVYDGGRTRHLVDWRTDLARAARHGMVSMQEQVAATTVALALERSRFRQQTTVYGQYVRKMSCLAQALEAIVATDRGRASELVQARKSLQTAELALAQSQSLVRQIETRLRRVIGTELPPAEGLSTALLEVPDLGSVLLAAAESAQIQQLTAQSQAADRLAQSVDIAARPKLSWAIDGSARRSRGAFVDEARHAAASFAMNMNIPLYNPATSHASDSAHRRARAAVMQRDDALEARRTRITETHEQATASFDRARRVSAVLRDSEQLRNFTLQQWQQLGRRSLFDVMNAEAEHYNLRVQYVNALHDGQQLNVVLQSLGRGVGEWLR
jgi:outer membrane protein TolC